MFNRIIRFLGGDPNKREIDKHTRVVLEINDLEPAYEQLTDEALAAQTDEFRRRLAQGESLDDILPQAFAAVREASRRTIGLRHYDVQLIGGMVLHEGSIAEMRTGEGKTLVATLPIYLNALALNPAWIERARRAWGDDPAKWEFSPLDNIPVGRGVHLITVNDYLARRDARWMGKIYDRLGLTTGVLQMAARTENGKKAFVVDFDPRRNSPHEDQRFLRMVNRAEAYAADVTYGTNSEFGFDYLRDNMTLSWSSRVQRGHAYALIDEVDNVLIDEARTPLIISGPAAEQSEEYVRMAQIVRSLAAEDIEISEKDRTVTLTEVGEAKVEDLLGETLRDPERPEDVNPRQARLQGYLEQALRAQHLYRRNKEYLVQGGKVVIVDEFTGRQMPGRRWSDGLHQAVEAKEGVRVQAETITYATVTIQNYFRMYAKLAGMSGTAGTEAEEFDKIYKLKIVSMPTNLEYEAARADTPLISVDAKDDLGYKYTYFTTKDQPDQRPLYYKRKDYPDIVYRTQEAKLRALATEIFTSHSLGRPVLVGTTSVELSERISGRLRAEPLKRLAMVLLLRSAWFRANKREEDGRQADELVFLDEPLEQLDEGQMRKMARSLELAYNPLEAANLGRFASLFGLEAEQLPVLKACLERGIPHNVLNARKHDEESQIIAKAGTLASVTIATNMAGRGVDIRLGGEFDDSLLADIKQYLRDQGVERVYRLSLIQVFEALLAHLAGFLGIPQADLRNLIEQYPASYPQLLRKQIVANASLAEALTQSTKLNEFDLLGYALAPADLGQKFSAGLTEFWRHAEQEVQVRALGGLHVIGSERHEARRIDNQLRGRSARQGDPGSSRFYLSMEDDLMRLFGGEQAESLLRRLKVDNSLPLEMGLVGRMIEQSQTRVEGANFDTRKHLLEYDDVLNSQRAKIYAQRDLIFTKPDLHEDVQGMLRDEIKRRVPDALKSEDGSWKLLAWLEEVQPTQLSGNQVIPSFTMRLLLDHLNGAAHTTETLRPRLLELAQNALLAEHEHLLLSVHRLLDANLERLESQRQERLEALDNYFESLGETDEDENGRRTGSAIQPRRVVEEVSELVHLPIRLSREQERELARDPQALQDIVQREVELTLLSQSIKRLTSSIEMRLKEDLEIDLQSLPADDWGAVASILLDTVERALAANRTRLISEQGGGLLGRELDGHLGRLNGEITPLQTLDLLLRLPQASQTTFDKRTHKRKRLVTSYFSYVFFAGRLLEGRNPDELLEEILAHTERALEFIQNGWGRSELTRLANTPLNQLHEVIQGDLAILLGGGHYLEVANQTVGRLPDADRPVVGRYFGQRVLTELHRHLLLRVITDGWVEYLTQIEALRVSIGLEAYGQRDPLVQYKSKASQMFNDLLDQIRLGVVSRMFSFRLNDMSPLLIPLAKNAARPALSEAEAVASPVEAEVLPEPEPEGGDEAEGEDEVEESGGAPGGESRSAKRRRRRR